jgi:hypothetical protein
MEIEPYARLYEDCGLKPEVAARAARLTIERLGARSAPRRRARGSLRDRGDRDPVGTIRRIAGSDDGALPLVDGVSGTLSLPAVSVLLEGAGLAPMVALAYAKVVVEACRPEDFYRPVWSALGRSGPVVLGELREAEWATVARAAASGEPTRTAISTTAPGGAVRGTSSRGG